MNQIWAKQALTADGWQRDVLVICDSLGRIASVQSGASKQGTCVDILLPAPANLHSHTFQRAMAGMTERRGSDPHDNFWSWRALMYKFMDNLSPDDVEAIAAFAFMEMLETGFGAVAEFHYLHHGPGGSRYDSPAEMSLRILKAAKDTGIGLTLLPVLYEQAGCDGRALERGQKRFGHDIEQFSQLVADLKTPVQNASPDTHLGIAPHSLRAVNRESVRTCAELLPDTPLHIHAAEQVGEVDEVVKHYGARPVEWLLENHNVDARWCFIHATQMLPHETKGLAASGAVAGLCPITEGNLGDGIFDGPRYRGAGGAFGVGTDSNIRISLPEELRMLEYAQRLYTKNRAVMAESEQSNGRAIWDAVTSGGAQALGRRSGEISPGLWADMVAVHGNHPDVLGRERDAALDSFVFAGDRTWVTDLWSAGRHCVSRGAHIQRELITANYKQTVQSLMSRIG